MSAPKKPHDLVLYGATGVTGRQMFLHLARHAPSTLRWAIAGRNRRKLERLAREGAAAASAPDLVLAESGDALAVEPMVARTRVLLNAAGPYAVHGETFFRACVEHGTDYVDIGGETFFIRRMLRRYHAEAARRGVKLIPVCGYEALPFDLATLLAVRRIRERFDSGCAEMKVIVTFARTGHASRASDLLSGGSVGTVKNLLELDDSDCFVDPACLNPETPDRDAIRARHAYDFRPRFDADVHAWVAPLFPAPFLNVPVVLRSAALHAESGEPYGEGFRYVEGTNTSAFTQRGPFQWAAASALGGSYAGMATLFRHDLRIARRGFKGVLDAVAPTPGQGPSDAAMEAGSWRLDCFARSERGDRLSGAVHGQGHPGYRTTGTMAAEAALALVLDRERLAPFTGLVTPATGLGLALCDPLKRAGMEFTVE